LALHTTECCDLAALPRYRGASSFLIIRPGRAESSTAVGVNFPTRWGVQPIARILHEKDYTYARLADEIGVARTHVYNACNGMTVPNEKLRDEAPAKLGVPLSRLWHADVLSQNFGDTAPKRRAS
jgi:hypothetical protein